MTHASPLNPDQFRKGSVQTAFARKSQSARLDQDRTLDPHATESAFIRAHIDWKWLFNEDVQELSSLCWPGYAGMSPFERTELFIAKYQKIYPEKWRKWKGQDRDRGPYQDRLAENDQELMTAFYGARISADLVGMPYDDYIRLACDVMVDSYSRRKFLPKPGQLQIKQQHDDISWWAHKVMERWLAEGNTFDREDVEHAPTPDCFGMTEVGKLSVCAGCPFSEACTRTWQRTAGRMMQEYHSTDPRGDHRKAGQNKRTAECRARKAERAELNRTLN